MRCWLRLSKHRPLTRAAEDCVLVDCTLGLGGHAHALLAACPEAQLIGLDRDPQALALRARAAGRVCRPDHSRRGGLRRAAGGARQGSAAPRCKGFCLTSAISSLQIDDPERGFAYAQDAPLDMRMGRQELTAAEILNTYSRAELSRILRTYGEERYADQIARRIVAEREREPFATSGRLVQLLYDTVPAASRKTGGHPAKRTFQALRIEVNAELESLESVLPSAIAALALRWPDRRVGLPLARGQVGQANPRPGRSGSRATRPTRSSRPASGRSCGC